VRRHLHDFPIFRYAVVGSKCGSLQSSLAKCSICVSTSQCVMQEMEMYASPTRPNREAQSKSASCIYKSLQKSASTALLWPIPATHSIGAPDTCVRLKTMGHDLIQFVAGSSPHTSTLQTAVQCKGIALPTSHQRLHALEQWILNHFLTKQVSLLYISVQGDLLSFYCTLKIGSNAGSSRSRRR
jgi:hypothetical protein